MLHSAALLTADESRAADRAAIESGIAEKTLMKNAARAVADYIARMFHPSSALVVCGPGNNGGDGVIVARLLKKLGWRVMQSSSGDFKPAMLDGKALVVDALFGTGLSRPVEGNAKIIIDCINASNLPVVAIDIASGIDAATGAIMGAAIRATHTVTFVRPKIGQLLLPGKAHTGALHVADIGVKGDGLSPTHFLNSPSLWKKDFPTPRMQSHKYTRGHALVIGGGIDTTGAARLAAAAALRIGSGLVSVACSSESLPVYAAALTSVMTKVTDTPGKLDILLEDSRISAVLIGPGCGVNEETRERALQILSHKKPCLLDADALSIFKNDTARLFSAIAGPVVMTPHEGEFASLFSLAGCKTERAREAAKQSGAVIVLKGSDTVIASPDGKIAVGANAPPWLATAGSGDVLAGMITGLLAQGMPAWEAACAGAWLHGEAASKLGRGMIAEDLPAAVPSVLQSL